MTKDRQQPAQQDEVIAFLSKPESLGGREPVERIETHAALVFLAGDRASRSRRRWRSAISTSPPWTGAARRWPASSSSTAPTPPRSIALVPVMRKAGGGLALGGEGEPVEWALLMRRFDQDQLLDRIAARGSLDFGLATALADAVLAAHRTARWHATSTSSAP
jgi:uncharacterized protein